MGSNTIRLVARRFAKPWLLHSVSLKEDAHPSACGTDSAVQKEPVEEEKPELKRPASPTLAEEEPERKRQKVEGEESWAGQAASQRPERLSGGAGKPMLGTNGPSTTPVRQEEEEEVCSSGKETVTPNSWSGSDSRKPVKASPGSDLPLQTGLRNANGA